MQSDDRKAPQSTTARVAALAVAIACLWSPHARGGEALVIYESLRVTEVDAANALSAILIAHGLTVDARDVSSAFPTDPGDLADEQCVWDLRVDNALFPVEAARYDAYVRNGGSIYLAGEHGLFPLRNNSIASLIDGLGGGPVAIAAVPPVGIFPVDIFEPVNQDHPVSGGCSNPVDVVDYDGIANGSFLSLGTGIWLTGTATATGAAAWDPGTLAFAPTGRAVLVLDVNYISPGFQGTLDVQTDGITPTENRAFVENLVTHLCGLEFPGCECAPRNHGYWHRYCLGTSTIDPGRNGQGNGPGPSHDSPDLPANLTALVDADLAAHGIGSCAALDDGPFSDKRAAALRELATLRFDLRSGYLMAGCPVELHPMDDTATDVGDAIALMESLIAGGSDDDLEKARWIGEHVANREAIVH